jgi:hypothetical protein
MFDGPQRAIRCAMAICDALLRLRELFARAEGDEAGYRDFRDRYRDMARTVELQGHRAWAEAMPSRRLGTVRASCSGVVGACE